MSKNNASRRNAKKTTKETAKLRQSVDWGVVDRAVRGVAADAFAAGGYEREASELRACAPIDDEDTARAAYLLATGFAYRSLGEQADALVGDVVCIAMAAERGDLTRLEDHRAKIESAVLFQAGRRTARDLYRDAVRARLGMNRGEFNFNERPGHMSPGEMLLMSLGGICLTDDLFEAMRNVCSDLRRIRVLDGEEGETLESITTRLEVIAWIHDGALNLMRDIELEGGAT